MYALKRVNDGKYVAKSGNAQSYTNRIDRIQAFVRKEDAEVIRCVENEYIVDIDDILKRPL